MSISTPANIEGLDESELVMTYKNNVLNLTYKRKGTKVFDRKEIDDQLVVALWDSHAEFRMAGDDSDLTIDELG